MRKIHCSSPKLYKHMYIMYVPVLRHILVFVFCFLFAWCIRFKLFACAFKALKYSDSDFISVVNVCCHFFLAL